MGCIFELQMARRECHPRRGRRATSHLGSSPILAATGTLEWDPFATLLGTEALKFDYCCCLQKASVVVGAWPDFANANHASERRGGIAASRATLPQPWEILLTETKRRSLLLRGARRLRRKWSEIFAGKRKDSSIRRGSVSVATSRFSSSLHFGEDVREM